MTLTLLTAYNAPYLAALTRPLVMPAPEKVPDVSEPVIAPDNSEPQQVESPCRNFSGIFFTKNALTGYSGLKED